MRELCGGTVSDAAGQLNGSAEEALRREALRKEFRR